MAAIKDSLATLERHIQLLEENVQKFSNALNHWRQWKEEYETLREDVKSLPQSAGREERARTREGFEGELLKEKELVEIFGKNDSKKPDQIENILVNRLDYVTKSIQTLEKQLETAQNKLAAATVVSNPDVATDEDGLPITEIMEELDDDDNVISYSLRTPGGDNQAQLLEALEKLGIKEEDISEGNPSPADKVVRNGDTPTTSDSRGKQTPPLPAQPAALSSPSKDAQERKAEDSAELKTVTKKKSVAFAEDTKPAEEHELETSKRLVDILRKARDEQTFTEDPIIPADESPDDASLREDMIRYNKETMEFEMAPIVAELNLEEGSDIDTDECSDFYEDEDDDDDEDEWGRSKNSVVDDDWKHRMLELKERLSQQHTFGAKKATDNDSDDSDEGEGIGRITIRHEESLSSEQSDKEAKDQGVTPPSNGKKEVRFAQALEVADELAVKPAPAPAPAQAKSVKKVVDPISDVMERTSGKAEPTPKSNKRPSRFRRERMNGPSSVSSTPTFQGMPIPSSRARTADRESDLADQGNFAPSGPEGRTLATSILEHELSAEAREPDEFDAGLLQQQAAEEYYKMRNRFVHREGGFLREDERPVRPLEEEEGGPKRVSRFKAARLARS